MAVATAAVVGTAVSAYGAHSANKRGKAAAKAQKGAHGDQMRMAQEQMDFGRQHYDWSRGNFDEYRDRFDPVLDQLTTESMAERTPDYGMITADTQAAFGSARDAGQRNLERYGIKPGDGQWGANDRRYGIGQSTAEVGARQQARRANENDQYSRLASLYGIGMNLQGQAMGGMNTGANILQGSTGMGINAAGQAANMHGNRANTYGQLASNNMAGFVNNLGSVVDNYMQQPWGEESQGGFDDNGMPWAGTTRRGGGG